MKLKAVVCLLAFFSFTGLRSRRIRRSLTSSRGTPTFATIPAHPAVPSFNLHGGSASVAYNVNNWLGAVADFGGYHANNISQRR